MHQVDKASTVVVRIFPPEGKTDVLPILIQFHWLLIFANIDECHPVSSLYSWPVAFSASFGTPRKDHWTIPRIVRSQEELVPKNCHFKHKILARDIPANIDFT